MISVEFRSFHFHKEKIRRNIEVIYVISIKNRWRPTVSTRIKNVIPLKSHQKTRGDFKIIIFKQILTEL
jgi:hypothetical protein